LNVFSKLPILRKLDLRDNESAFHAERLPEGEKVNSEAKSTGTTGMPVRVRHTVRSNRMFALLKQREYRWFQFDPRGTLAMIRSPRALARRPDGSLLAEGEEIRVSNWPGIGRDFSTGPAIAFSILNPPEHQIAWLRQILPDHLLVLSATLEHLAFAAGDQRPCKSLTYPDTRRALPLSRVVLGGLQQSRVQSPPADAVRAVRDPMGPGHVERYVAPESTLYEVRAPRRRTMAPSWVDEQIGERPFPTNRNG
jgi:hypothetical protein